MSVQTPEGTSSMNEYNGMILYLCQRIYYNIPIIDEDPR